MITVVGNANEILDFISIYPVTFQAGAVRRTGLSLSLALTFNQKCRHNIIGG
jgi:hypothetical protein